MRNQVRIEAKIDLQDIKHQFSFLHILYASASALSKEYCRVVSMDVGLYTIHFDFILKWMLIGFAVTFFIKDIQKSIYKKPIHLKAAIVFAISLSILLLLLLIEGYDITIVAILSFGAGIITHLALFTIYSQLHRFFTTKPIQSIHKT